MIKVATLFSGIGAVEDALKIFAELVDKLDEEYSN